ncbi:MAG: SIR2 family NAD-dependent protein deacylase [Candidatus Flexifilum sp.]|jgi:NAD-dependent deacetylase
MNGQRNDVATNAISAAAERLAAAQRIVILTGAGVSQESGVPTFRDALTGLWAQYDPTRLATPQAFRANPRLVWNFYQYRRRLMSPAQPNAGHLALARLEELRPHVTLITQNVDDLHERAGSRAIIRLHGSIWRSRCSAECGWSAPVQRADLDGEADEAVPLCPACGAYQRPDVVWFNEALPRTALDRAAAVSETCEVLLIVGTSGLVMPAAALPEVARSAGAFVIDLNPEASVFSRSADLWLAGTAAQVLPRIIAELERRV